MVITSGLLCQPLFRSNIVALLNIPEHPLRCKISQLLHWEVNVLDSENVCGKFDIFISELVVREAGAGDKTAAQKRLEALEAIPLLKLNKKVLSLASELVQGGHIPESAKEDALHIALATVHGMDYILTWNCRHIANAEMRTGVTLICISQGYEAPIICTPEELMGE